MPKNPLAEVFGFPIGNMSQEAKKYRKGRWCPYNNPSGLNCTKSSATDPLGVCSIFDGDKIVITCPVRLRQGVTILDDATDFFFPDKRPITLTEVRLKDREGKAAGNIDIVLAAIDENDKVIDFGAIEIQAVDVSDDVIRAFKQHTGKHVDNDMPKPSNDNQTKIDYFALAKEQLATKLIHKGKVLQEQNKRFALVVDRPFFEYLPHIEETSIDRAELALLVYELEYDVTESRYVLKRHKSVYTDYLSATRALTNR